MGLVSFRTDSGTGFIQDRQWDWFPSGQIVVTPNTDEHSGQTMGLVSFRTDSGTGFIQDKQWDWFPSGQIVGLV